MKLEVGKYYKDRGGEVVMIVKYEEDEAYPYSDNEGETYQENGRYFTHLECEDDLIEEVIPVPAYRVKAEQTDTRDFIRSMEGEKGKVYTKFRVPSYVHKKFINMGGWSYYATQVDAGYIDPITGEFVMNENESVSKKLKLEVGKTYKTRDGETVKITNVIDHGAYSFRGTNMNTYTEEGLRYDWIPDHEYNLVEEVTAPKLKLEVGKTYRDSLGNLYKIDKISESRYPEHVYWSESRSFTVEGFWDWNKKIHKYNLIEEVEVEVETTTTKKEQPKMKYYRTTEKNTEANDDFLVGTIVTLFKDDTTGMPSYKDINSDRKQYLYTDRLEEINVKTVKTVISPASKLVKILEDGGYEVGDDGSWRKDGARTFNCKMFCFCGEELPNRWSWLPEWLEEKIVFDSVVNTFNARQFIVDFMKKKRELSHEAYLYQRDIDEIENEWSDAECDKVAGRILAQGGFWLRED